MREFKKPDLNAPRYRKKAHSIFGKNEAFFKSFKKKNPEYEDLDNTTFRKIITHHLSLLAKDIAETRDGIELGDQIGVIFLGGMKIKSSKVKAVNFAKSLKHGKTIRGGNLNQDGLTAKIYFSTQDSKYRMKGRQLWTFKSSRDLSRDCSKNFAENWDKYIVLDNLKSINMIFRRHNNRNINRRITERDKQFFEDFDV